MAQLLNKEEVAATTALPDLKPGAEYTLFVSGTLDSETLTFQADHGASAGTWVAVPGVTPSSVPFRATFRADTATHRLLLTTGGGTPALVVSLNEVVVDQRR